MTSVEDRLTLLEHEMAQIRPSLYRRLDQLEQATKVSDAEDPGKSPSGSSINTVRNAIKGIFSWMGAELPKLLTALVILFVGWGIKDSVDLSIKQRQLDLSYATEMQTLLATMGEKNTDRNQLNSTAVVLASFGAPAITPLLSELSEGDIRRDAAIKGILLLALTQPKPVCEALPRVLNDRGRQFDWQTQEAVIDVLGEYGCKNAIVPLNNYRAVVTEAQAGETSAFAQIVTRLPRSPTENYQDLIDAIDLSLESLKR